MKRIKLTQDKFAIVDDEDFEFLNGFKWFCNSKGYAVRNALNADVKIQKMHRLIMRAKKGEIVDHINRNTLDNRKQNLRICTKSENVRNACLSKRNRSGVKGVYKFVVKWKTVDGTIKSSTFWKAAIRLNGKVIFLGYFKRKMDAWKAYTGKAKELGLIAGETCTKALRHAFDIREGD